MKNSVNSDSLTEALTKNKVEVKSIYNQNPLIIILKNDNIYEINQNGNVDFIGTNVIYTDVEPIMQDYRFFLGVIINLK